MKETPIVFDVDMVKAILEGRKTLTIQVVRQNSRLAEDVHKVDFKRWCDKYKMMDICHFGEIGDHLWVKEPWWQWGCWDDTGSEYPEEKFWDGTNKVHYEAGDEPLPKYEHIFNHWRKRSSVHMPREFSRILLEITNVRVERVSNVSEKDAEVEGCVLGCTNDIEGCALDYCRCEVECPEMTYKMDYINKFDKKYAKKYGHSWNPWVWIIEFRRIS